MTKEYMQYIIDTVSKVVKEKNNQSKTYCNHSFSPPQKYRREKVCIKMRTYRIIDDEHRAY